jgi:hypothetical protein
MPPVPRELAAVGEDRTTLDHKAGWPRRSCGLTTAHPPVLRSSSASTHPRPPPRHLISTARPTLGPHRACEAFSASESTLKAARACLRPPAPHPRSLAPPRSLPPSSANLLPPPPPTRASSNVCGDRTTLDHKAGWPRRSCGLAPAHPPVLRSSSASTHPRPIGVPIPADPEAFRSPPPPRSLAPLHPLTHPLRQPAPAPRPRPHCAARRRHSRLRAPPLHNARCRGPRPTRSGFADSFERRANSYGRHLPLG